MGKEGAAELGAQFAEPVAVAGHAGGVRAALAQRGGDGAAEARLAPVTSAVVPESG